MPAGVGLHLVQQPGRLAFVEPLTGPPQPLRGILRELGHRTGLAAALGDPPGFVSECLQATDRPLLLDPGLRIDLRTGPPVEIPRLPAGLRDHLPALLLGGAYNVATGLDRGCPDRRCLVCWLL